MCCSTYKKINTHICMISNLVTDEIANINSWYTRDVYESFDDSDTTSVGMYGRRIIVEQVKGVGVLSKSKAGSRVADLTYYQPSSILFVIFCLIVLFLAALALFFPCWQFCFMMIFATATFACWHQASAHQCFHFASKYLSMQCL